MRKKILIAYFSHSGNTKILANLINETVGGDIFEIKTIETYPKDYNSVVDIAKKEQIAGIRPELSAKVADMPVYDTVFIGYPNWWGTVPMAVYTFLETYDFSAKTILPFCTHEGSGMGRSLSDIKQLCPDCDVLDGLAVRDSRADQAQGDISVWLRGIDLPKEKE